MSQVDNVFENMTEEEIAAYSVEPEAEDHIVIGKDRFITIPDSLKKIAVQYDHDVETVTFDCPRYWDGIDLSTMVVYINYMLSNGYTDSYPTEVEIDEEDESIMHFDWTISRNVTQVNGAISFLVCIKKTDEDGNEVNHWNSELNNSMIVSKGMECTQTPLAQYQDLVTKLLLRVEACINDTTERINACVAEAELTMSTATDAKNEAIKAAEDAKNSVAQVDGARLVGQKGLAGEIFNDYKNNRAGSKGFTIVGVERDGELTDDMVARGWDKGFSVPDMDDIDKAYDAEHKPDFAYFSDFENSTTVGSANNSNPDDTNQVEDSEAYLESRVYGGASVVTDDQTGKKVLAVIGSYQSATTNVKTILNIQTQSVGNYKANPANSGRNFVYSLDVKLGEYISAGYLMCMYCTLVDFSERVMVKPIWVSSSGSVHNTTYGNCTDSNKIAQLSTDKYINIAVAVDVRNNTYNVYIDGGLAAYGQPFLSDATIAQITRYAGFENGFALSAIDIYREYVGTETKTIFYFDNMSLYFADSYKFGLGGCYELDSVAGLAKGDEYTTHVHYGAIGHGPYGSEQAENYGKIVQITGNKVYVDRLFCNGEFEAIESYVDGNGFDTEINIFRIVNKPTVGTRTIGACSHTGGSNNQSLVKGSTSFGGGNKSIGSWSVTLGRNLVAAYSAFATNNGNKALAHNSFAAGVGSVVRRWAMRSAVIGHNLIAGAIDQFITGRYNIEDTPDPKNGNRGKYLRIIGNGTSDSNRSNAYTLDQNGKGWYKGGLVVGGADQDDSSAPFAVHEDGTIYMYGRELVVGGSY